MKGKLVVVRHYEPEPADRMSALLHRVYDRLLVSSERLTREPEQDTIGMGDLVTEVANYAGGDIHAG
jgi:hypothetical protein